MKTQYTESSSSHNKVISLCGSNSGIIQNAAVHKRHLTQCNSLCNTITLTQTLTCDPKPSANHADSTAHNPQNSNNVSKQHLQNSKPNSDQILNSIHIIAIAFSKV